ncbi:MAG TPA: Crp/Fnr family transcriptional regulator [Chitinophagales bacterium]|nr:Crp/Fnr family transcriptional regulator [Chitinophagales bacterium]
MDSPELIAQLKASPKLLEQLYKFSIKKSYKAGETIFSEDSYSQSIPIVTKGVMKIIRTEEDGREILLYYIEPGEGCVISLSDAIHNETSKIRAEVEEDVDVLFLPSNRFFELVKEFPQWLDYILQLYHKRFEDLLEIINEISFKKVDERLLNLLHKKVELKQSKTIQITHEQLANELGTARVVVSRLLKQLENDGVVQLGRNKITII